MVMGRSQRILYPDAFYHVMNRGGARRLIYQNDDQRLLFLDLLKASGSKFNFEVHAYCLMGNHFHLLVRTPQANLSKAMHWITNRYSRQVNKEMRLDGSLFRGRFKAITVDADNYLAHVSRYIHLNPVKAKICARPHDYTWSSYKAYVDADSRPSWLHVDEVMLRIGLQAKPAHYVSFVENPSMPSLDEFFRRPGSAHILGSKQFQKYLMATIADSHLRSLSAHDASDLELRFQRIVAAVESQMATSHDDILSPTQGRKSWARSTAIYLTKRCLGSGNSQLGNWFGISHAAVSLSLQRFAERLGNDSALNAKVKTIEEVVNSQI